LGKSEERQAALLHQRDTLSSRVLGAFVTREMSNRGTPLDHYLEAAVASGGKSNHRAFTSPLAAVSQSQLHDELAMDFLSSGFSSGIAGGGGGGGGGVGVGAGGAGSSKAVLAALRALQDKIKRLEAERTQALDEVSELKHALKHKDLEADHAKQRDELASSKQLQESRAACDKLLTERGELESKLSRLEESHRDQQQQAHAAHIRIESLEEQKLEAVVRVKELETAYAALEEKINKAVSKEKELAQLVMWESRRHEEEKVCVCVCVYECVCY